MAISGSKPTDERRGEQRVGAEPDEGLLADRDQPGIAGEQVPVLRQRQHGEHEEQVLQQRRGRQNGRQNSEPRATSAARAAMRERVSPFAMR